MKSSTRVLKTIRELFINQRILLNNIIQMILLTNHKWHSDITDSTKWEAYLTCILNI